MRILHLEASAGWGGQEIRILREALGMRQRGHEVVLAVMNQGRLAEEARKCGFIVYEVGFKKLHWMFTLFRLLFLMRRHAIEMVNTHSSLDSWIGGIAARLMRIPLVRTRHLSTPIKAGWNSRLLYGFLADYVVTTCSAILPMLFSQSGKPLSKMRSIATGVDPTLMHREEAAAQEFRRSLGLSSDDFLIGTACFMRSWKGIGELLAAADFLRQTAHLRWVIIGGGHENAYRKKAEELDLGGIVHFTGHLADPISAIQALNAFTLLSTAHEGVSQAILQAAYLGKPLIATPTGGLCEVCLDGKTGIQVPVFSSNEVAHAVLTLMQSPELCKRFGSAARRLVEQKFTLQHTLDQMEEVYRIVENGIITYT